MSWLARRVERFSERTLGTLLKASFFLLTFQIRVDTDESDEYCPYCDNHYVLPAKGPEETFSEAELLQTPMLFNDPRMKPKLVELNEIDAELEALLRE